MSNKQTFSFERGFFFSFVPNNYEIEFNCFNISTKKVNLFTITLKDLEVGKTYTEQLSASNMFLTMHLQFKFKVLRIGKTSEKCVIRIYRALVLENKKKICNRGKILTASITKDPNRSEWYLSDNDDYDAYEDYEDYGCSCRFDGYGIWVQCDECRRDYGAECSCRGGCAMCA